MARITVINDSPEFLDLMNEVVSNLGHQMTGLEAIHTSIEEVVETNDRYLIVKKLGVGADVAQTLDPRTREARHVDRA